MSKEFQSNVENFPERMKDTIKRTEEEFPSLSASRTFPSAGDFSATIVPVSDLDRVQRIAEQDGPVLIVGESGTGKSTLARKLHKMSNRRLGPLIRRGCGEFDSGTLKDQLFGHTKGAFTGATSPLRGLLDMSDGGTLVLDDIDYLPLEAQSAFLRFLDDGVYSRLGEPGTDHRTDVRLIVTSNKNLDLLCSRGEFLPDLLNRVQRWCVWLPPLREDRSRLRHLASCLLEEKMGKGGLKGQVVTAEALDLLCTMPWPGNIRQLSHAIEILALFGNTTRGSMTAGEVARVLLDAPGPRKREFVAPGRTSQDDRIHQALTITGGNVAMASRILGCSRTTIYARIKAKGWQLPR